MPYLIDGNNLRNAGRDRRLGIPIDEVDFIHYLDAFARSRRRRLTVVFDGPGRGAAAAVRPSGTGACRVFHSGPRRTADDVIVEHVRRSGAPADIIVVTSDRALGARVRTAGARLMGCRRFSEILSRRADGGTGEEEKPLPEDIDWWERYFAGDD